MHTPCKMRSCSQQLLLVAGGLRTPWNALLLCAPRRSLLTYMHANLSAFEFGTKRVALRRDSHSPPKKHPHTSRQPLTNSPG